MDVSKLPLFQAMAERMHWLGQRQHVLAQNIANLNTPGYRAADLKESDFAAMVGRAGRKLALASTSGVALGGAGLGAGLSYDIVRDTTPAETTPSGNGVMLEDQLRKVADTQADYQAIVGLYRKHLALIKMAIGGTGR